MAFSCSQSREHCQSRFFKEWHPDYIAAYNSLGDPHLRHYFAHPARKNHLSRNHQVILLLSIHYQYKKHISQERV